MLNLWLKILKALSKLINVDYLKVKCYEVNIEVLKRRRVYVGKDSIIINCIFSTSSKGDEFIIGYNSTLLPGVTICDDVVVAAGSVVTKSIFESGVYGGNPAKKISDLDSYISKFITRFEENMSDF